MLEDCPDVDAVIIPVGGGGLLAGVSVALKTLKPDIKIIVSLININITNEFIRVYLLLKQYELHRFSHKHRLMLCFCTAN